MDEPAYRLDDLAALIGVSRERLDRELEGLEADLGVVGHGASARFPSAGELLRFLEYRRTLEEGPSSADTGLAALEEILRLAGALEELDRERHALEMRVQELRRLLHKVVVENVALTQRVNELSILRLRYRSQENAGPWYRRLLARLWPARSSAPAGGQLRRVA